MGETKIMDTLHGKIVKNLIDEGVNWVYLQEVWDSHNQDRSNVVGKDFYLATAADIVADPSAPDALQKVLWKRVGMGQRVLKSMEVEKYKEEIEKTKRAELVEKINI